MIPSKLQGLINNLYQCALDNFNFDSFTSEVGHVFSAYQASLCVIDTTDNKVLYGWAHGYPQGVINIMIRMGLILKDEAIRRGLDASEPCIQIFSDHDPNFEVKNELGPFSRTWAVASGLVDCAVVTNFDRDNNHVILVLNRHKSVGHYDHGVTDQLMILQQHMGHVFSANNKKFSRPSGFDPFERFIFDQHQPSLLLTNNSEVIACNKHFECLASLYPNTINILDNVFTLVDRKSREEYEKVMLEMILTDHEPGVRRNMIIPCNNRLPLILELSHAFGPEGTECKVILVMHDPNKAIEIRVDRVMNIIKATESEARVVASLAEGKTPIEVSEKLELTQNTVRSYIKSVLAKNNYNRQVDLINDIQRVLRLIS